MTSIQLSVQSFQEHCVQLSKAKILENFNTFLSDYSYAFLATSVLQHCVETKQNLIFHFKKYLWFRFFYFLVNCKYFRTSQTQLCFTFFPTSLYHFYINSHHVARLALNGQSENKAHKLQLVWERELCKELGRHKGRTNCMNFMLCVQGLTGMYYFDRLLSLFTRCWIMRKASSQRHWYCSQNCTWL